MASAEPTSLFSDRQRRLLDRASAYGRGYALFAASVEKQGWCSPKQEEALYNMCNAAEYRQNNWRGRGGGKAYKHDISDCEAMQSGDFF